MVTIRSFLCSALVMLSGCGNNPRPSDSGDDGSVDALSDANDGTVDDTVGWGCTVSGDYCYCYNPPQVAANAPACTGWSCCFLGGFPGAEQCTCTQNMPCMSNNPAVSRVAHCPP